MYRSTGYWTVGIGMRLKSWSEARQKTSAMWGECEAGRLRFCICDRQRSGNRIRTSLGRAVPHSAKEATGKGPAWDRDGDIAKSSTAALAGLLPVEKSSMLAPYRAREYWILDTGSWRLDTGDWIPNTGYRILGFLFMQHLSPCLYASLSL
jgi:hypothetical protein